MRRLKTVGVYMLVAFVCACAKNVPTDDSDPSLNVAGVPGCEPFPACAHGLSPGQFTDVDAAIDEMESAECEAMADLFRDALDEGRILSYDDYDGNWGDTHRHVGVPDDPDAVYHLWQGTFDQNRVENNLRHEYGHVHEDTPSESVAEGYETSCDGEN